MSKMHVVTEVSSENCSKNFFLIKSGRGNIHFSQIFAARKQKVQFTRAQLDHVEVS